MKKIMKKALSLMLALVMMLSLAPMTVKAEETLSVKSGSATMDSGWGYEVISFKAPGNGVIKVSLAGTPGWDYQFINDNTYFQSDWLTSSDSANNNLTYDVSAGDACTVVIYAYDPETEADCAGTVIYDFQFIGEVVEGATDPTGTSATDAIPLEGNPAYITAPGSAQTYYKVTLEAGVEYTINMQCRTGDFDFFVYDSRFGMPSWCGTSEYGVFETTITATAQEFIFAIGNSTLTEEAIQVTLTSNSGENGGTQENPEVITVLGDKTVDCTTLPYWCQWEAVGTGLFTVTVDAEEPTFGVYTVNDGWDYNAKKTDTEVSVEVTEGDVVLFYVRDFANTTVDFTTSFVAGATLPEDEDDGEGDDLGDEVENNFQMSDTAIVVGDNELSCSAMYPYTVFTFEPTEIGVYTFTSEDSVFGIVGYYWVTEDLVNAEVVKENSLEWKCTSVGQGIYLAVKADTNVANITVERDELVVETIPVYDRYASVSLESYVFDGELDDLDRLMYIDVENYATVMDEDGYWHLVPGADVNEDGSTVKPITDYPYILMKLNDSTLSLQSAIGYGKVAYTEYDSDGKAEYIYNYNPMIEEYLACADTTDKLYPVTDDLVEIMYYVGFQQGWYEETGIVAATFANDGVDEYMLPYFAMYYLDQDITTLDKEEPVVDKDAMADIIASNKDKETVINTVTTNAAGEEVEVTFTFAAGTMELVDGKDEYNFEVKLVEDYDKATADKVEINKDKFVLRINFAYEGKLPAEATISIPVGTAYANKTLYYYQILADGTLEYVCDAPVDAAGNAKVTQDHCSDYVLLAEKLADTTGSGTPGTVAPGGTTTGDATNIALWVAILGLGVVAIAGSVVMKKREF